MTAATVRGLATPVAAAGDEGAVLLAGPAQEVGAERLEEHDERLGPLPDLSPENVTALVDAAGLTGRGGGRFPFARKLAAVAGAASDAGPPVVVVNLSESEPASRKDQVLAELRPNLLLDGVSLASRAVGARTAVVYLHRGDVAARRAVENAIRERVGAGRPDPEWRVSLGPGRYVAGEATAVVSHLDGGRAVPRWSPTQIALAGVAGRPTLLSNAETFTHVGLIARLGPQSWSAAGPGGGHGPMLLTLQGDVTGAGQVVEVVAPTTLGQVLRLAGGVTAPPQAVLLGGYAGTWIAGATAWRQSLDPAALADARATIGCGVVGVLGHDRCGLEETARLVRWLAGEGAGQCGPCALGLPRLAGAVSAPRRRPGPVSRRRPQLGHGRGGAGRLPPPGRCGQGGEERSRGVRGRCPAPPAGAHVPARGESGGAARPGGRNRVTGQVHVDPTRCAGHGICALILDDHVTVDEWGFPRVDGEVLAGRRDLRRAARAARACPRQALVLALRSEEPGVPATRG